MKQNFAICFFGQVKNYTDKLYNNYKNNIEKILIHNNILFDRHIVTYNNTWIKNSRNQEDCSIDYKSIFNYIHFKTSIILDINSLEIQNIDTYATQLANKYGCSWQSENFISTIFAIRQIYGLQKILTNIKYNKYIFLRPDLLFESKLPDEFFDDNYDACLPMFDSYGGYNDRFCVLNDTAANIYCNRFNLLIEKPLKYHSENFLKKIFDANKLKVKQIDNFFFKRVRCNGIQK